MIQQMKAFFQMQAFGSEWQQLFINPRSNDE